MDLKKALNLNSYEWWRRHRKVVTYGGFLLIFAWYIRPANYKDTTLIERRDTCAELAANKINLKDFAAKYNIPLVIKTSTDNVIPLNKRLETFCRFYGINK